MTDDKNVQPKVEPKVTAKTDGFESRSLDSLTREEQEEFAKTEEKAKEELAKEAESN